MDTAKFRCTRDQFCEALKAEGVPTAVHYPRTLTRQPAFKRFADVQGHPPMADKLSSMVFALPIHHMLSDEQIKSVGEAMNKVAGAYRA
jgi:dTDP-4-amino-4,6-dideoxygalactose transaminase